VNTPHIEAIEPWAPSPEAAPRTRRQGDTLIAAANGTRFCSGGWQVRFSGVAPGQAYRIAVPIALRGLKLPRDVEHAKVIAFWGPMGPSDLIPKPLVHHDPLILAQRKSGSFVFVRDAVAPKGATALTVRLTFRWSARGEAVFGIPRLRKTTLPPPRRVRIAVVTGSDERRRAAGIRTVADNVAYYLDLCKRACADKADLIVLPEIALQWGTGETGFERGVALDGPELRPFIELARKRGRHILVGLLERDRDAQYNSAVLVGPGGIVGVYRKVHLAECGETHSGLLPGDSFPVFDTPIGRIGANICMDTSAAESSRMIGLNGADILLMPIMGDHRADRFSCGTPFFHEGRWKAIMRTRALDNQFIMVAARNEALGSCIIDQRGEFLAYNDGTEDIVAATVELDPDYRKWVGGPQRDIIWLQRRPKCYGAFVEPAPPAVRFLRGYGGA
jgi:predicted amidohydrolase